jgi:DNA/RNA non-specific endonuclease
MLAEDVLTCTRITTVAVSILQSRCAAQAPAANHKGSQKALEETFKLTNISPQVGKGFNRCAVFIGFLQFVVNMVYEVHIVYMTHNNSMMQLNSSAFQLARVPDMCRDYWARFEHFLKQLTNTCEEVGNATVCPIHMYV